jgi:hypothetical protein
MTARIYTASWSALWKASKLGPLPAVPVRISRGLPKFWPAAEQFPAVESLMPDPWMFSIPEDDPERFGRAYRRKLHTIGLPAIQAELDRISGQNKEQKGGIWPLALACFEADPADCHRGPLGFAGWWERKTGVVVTDLGTLAAEPEDPQLQLPTTAADAAEGQ